ncbi:integral membrane protein PTH11 [Fusarium circinatum]|uniref:Integral membrane protein PTH11 n=1 Tax=Fusarium circinatum TaxID=48490 RepID=A0A8H5UDX3_FUSCI|nr:integral membrane protein PTH11 [Fusarium circinatum]
MSAVPTIEPRGLGLAQLITSILFGILTTVVVFLRTFIRLKNRVFGVDDMLMVIGYILFAILVGVSSKGTYYGAGQRDAVLPEGIYPHGKFYVWLFQIFYCASLVFIKASICDALLRIAVIPWHRVVAWMTLAMAVICAMIVFIGLFVLCKPLSATWNGDGKCSPPSALAILACFVSASSILTDIICAALPALMLYKAQMKLATKVSISMVLGLGALASVATIIRMPYVLFYFHPNPDYLYRHFHVSLWSTVEAGIGIIAGSLPALRKFVKRWITFDSSARQYSPPKPYGGSHGLGITSHIGTASRVKGYNISRDVENDGKDHWEGAGKSTLAKAIVTQLPNFKRLSNDQIIYESHGLYKIDYAAEQYEAYQQEASQKLIAELERILLEKSNDLVLDLSFYDKEYRDEYKDIVERHGGRWVLVYLDADRDVLWNRIQQRRAKRDSLDAMDPERNGDSAFDIDDETFAMYWGGFEPPSGEGEIVIKKGLVKGAGFMFTEQRRRRMQPEHQVPFELFPGMVWKTSVSRVNPMAESTIVECVLLNNMATQHPDFDELPLDKTGPRGNAWGLWGRDDQLGTLNHLTDEVVGKATRENFKTGISVSLKQGASYPKFARKKLDLRLINKAPPKHAHDDGVGIPHLHLPSKADRDVTVELQLAVHFTVGGAPQYCPQEDQSECLVVVPDYMLGNRHDVHGSGAGLSRPRRLSSNSQGIRTFSGALSGLLAFGIDRLDGARGIARWRWIFLIEGAVTVAAGLVMPLLIIDTPERAKWLSDDDKRFVDFRLRLSGVRSNTEEGGKFLWKLLFKAMVD